MAKTKQREHSETEHLRGRIKKLESENRQLKKRLRTLDKHAHFYEDLVNVIPEDLNVDDKCEQCKKGKLGVLDLKYVRYLVCDNDDCEFKEKI